MLQEIPMTKEEKIKMYMKLAKRELAEMLYNANLCRGRTATVEPEMPTTEADHYYMQQRPTDYIDPNPPSVRDRHRNIY